MNLLMVWVACTVGAIPAVEASSTPEVVEYVQVVWHVDVPKHKVLRWRLNPQTRIVSALPICSAAIYRLNEVFVRFCVWDWIAVGRCIEHTIVSVLANVYYAVGAHAAPDDPGTA